MVPVTAPAPAPHRKRESRSDRYPISLSSWPSIDNPNQSPMIQKALDEHSPRQPPRDRLEQKGEREPGWTNRD